MLNFIKKFIPEQYKRDPTGLYNRLRKITGASRYRYDELRKIIEGNSEISELLPEEKMSRHYAHEVMRQSVDFPALYVNQIRYYRLYRYFKEYYPDMFNRDTRIIDVGDTSGILFQAMGKDGLSVNINEEVVRAIRENGIRADVQDAENLTYGDKLFDYGFCFQCLEHLKNPFSALDELGRVVKKKVFLSIPYVSRTNVCSKEMTARVKHLSVSQGGYGASYVLDSDCHVFEFSTKDFIKLLSFTRLIYVDNYPINYDTSLGSTKNNHGSFFNFFILEPKRV